MSNLTVTTITDRDQWNDTLRTLPCAHILQTWEWGEFKRATTGWQPIRLAFSRGDQVVALASVGVRRVGPLEVMYAPKGPALDYADADLVAEVLDYLQTMARKHGAIWLKLDPDVIAATGVPDEPDNTLNFTGQALIRTLKDRGWRFWRSGAVPQHHRARPHSQRGRTARCHEPEHAPQSPHRRA